MLILQIRKRNVVMMFLTFAVLLLTYANTVKSNAYFWNCRRYCLLSWNQPCSGHCGIGHVNGHVSVPELAGSDYPVLRVFGECCFLGYLYPAGHSHDDSDDRNLRSCVFIYVFWIYLYDLVISSGWLRCLQPAG